MGKENHNTQVGSADISYLEKELSKTKQPLPLDELTKKMAYQKNKDQLSQEVKVYDPNALYEVGDLIYKTYDEPLTVSSKGAEHFKGSVVLTVVNKIKYADFHCEMLEVDFSGGGTFRKHIDYMKKTNTQVLLPSNLESKALSPQILKKDKDPRLTELPMTEKDLRTLKNNLQSALSKSEEFFSWDQYWQLVSNKVEIKKSQVKTLQTHFKKNNASASTEDMVSLLFDIKGSNALFDLHCLSLNHSLANQYKKTFTFVAPDGWGRWYLKEALESLLKGLPVSARKGKVPSLEGEKKLSSPLKTSAPLKLYLTWREILSGALKIPRSYNKELTQAREYVFADPDEKKDYSVFYYPSAHLFLGLKAFYEKNQIPQGANLTLTRTGLRHFSLSLKKSKKKLNIPCVEYSPKDDKFSLDGEQTTYCLPNKIVYLEPGTLEKLFVLYSQRSKQDLRELLILVFKQFGLEGEYLFLHSQRAFHLVDTLRNTYQEDIDKVLRGSSEFSRSEKKKGVFMYMEEVEKEEVAPGEPSKAKEPALDKEEAPAPKDTLPEIGTIEDEMPAQELKEEETELKIVEVVEDEPAEKLAAEPEYKAEKIAEPPEKIKSDKPKKTKEVKKKERVSKIEIEKETRVKRGAKRIREEQIEIEESEMEALFAMKAKEKEDITEVKAEKPAKKEKEEFEQIPHEEPKFGLFAEKLKSALGEKDQDKPQPKKKTPKKKTAKKTTKKKPASKK